MSHKQRAEQLHHVQHQRRGRRARLVIEPQRRLQADRQQRAVDERLEQRIAEAQQAVEAVAGRTAISPVGPKLLGQAAVDQHPQAVEIGPGGRPFQSQQRGGRFRLGHVGQHAPHLVQAGPAPGAVGDLLAACPQNVAALGLDFRRDQAAGQIEPHGRIGQAGILADPLLHASRRRGGAGGELPAHREPLHGHPVLGAEVDGLRRYLAVAVDDDAVDLFDGDLLLLVLVGQEQGRAAAAQVGAGRNDVQRLLLPPRGKEPRTSGFPG